MVPTWATLNISNNPFLRSIGSFIIFITDLQNDGKKNFTKDSFMELLWCQLYLDQGNDFLFVPGHSTTKPKNDYLVADH